MRKEYESIDWDAKQGGIIITKQERIDLKDVEGIEDAKKMLRMELKGIVRQIRDLKQKGIEIKSLIDKLEGKADPITGSAQLPE